MTLRNRMTYNSKYERTRKSALTNVDRRNLIDWIVEALKELNGSAQIQKVLERIWEHHDREIIDSGNFHFTWQEDAYWAATQLRARGILKKSKETPGSVWTLTEGERHG